jgi:hypothetical protein
LRLPFRDTHEMGNASMTAGPTKSLCIVWDAEHNDAAMRHGMRAMATTKFLPFEGRCLDKTRRQLRAAGPQESITVLKEIMSTSLRNSGVAFRVIE